MGKDRPKVVLVWPEIPGNTGSVGRTCVALDMELILIKPYGFDINERTVRRAGLDYWQYIQLSEYQSWDTFLSAREPDDQEMFFFEEFGSVSVYDAQFSSAPWLIFGQETKGLPRSILDGHNSQCVRLPMVSDKVRSLNLANTVTAAAYQAMRGFL